VGGLRVGLDMEKRKFLTLLWPLSRSVHSQSLYQPQYPSSCDADDTELIHIKTCSNSCVRVVDPYDTIVCMSEWVQALVCMHVGGFRGALASMAIWTPIKDQAKNPQHKKHKMIWKMSYESDDRSRGKKCILYYTCQACTQQNKRFHYTFISYLSPCYVQRLQYS
jgi:hypothetical protein